MHLTQYVFIGSFLLAAANAVVSCASDDDAPDPKPTPGVCRLSECDKPKMGIACCTPDAQCGFDPSGLGFSCTPNDLADRECVLADCPTPILGTACCTPLAGCGWDPFGAGTLCLPNGAPIPVVDAGPVCDPSKCPEPDSGVAACCLPTGECGQDTLGIGFCFPPPPPPTCDITTCPAGEGSFAPCCLPNGECGIDALQIGFCFPPPAPCECPPTEAGVPGCCLPNGQCGSDALGIGICFPPPPAPTCDLASCPAGPNDEPACCLPNAQCGIDTLRIGLCFPPPPPVPDAGPISTTPPDDPSITADCPSFMGLFGPVWGCCSDFGVCGAFSNGQCLPPVGSQIPNPDSPPPEAGTTEPFLRCTLP